MYLLELKVRSSYFWTTWGILKKWSSGKNSYTCWRVRVFTWLHQKSTKLRKYYDAPIFVTSIAPIMFAGKSANINAMPWLRQGGRSSSCLFRFHCLNRKLSRDAQDASVNLCSWELMCKAFSQLLSSFWLSILCHVVRINYLTNNNWIYILSRLENTSWVVSWRKVFESLNCF